MKRLKVLICGLAITLPAMLLIYFDQPTGTAKAEAEKAVTEGEDEERETSAESGPQEEITNSIGMKLRLIPAESFMMGALPGDDEAEDYEKPPHQVEITKPFYIGVYEVTQAQYEAVMVKNPSWFKGPRRPVECVSWDDAVEFCSKLSQITGEIYRLPTEAEWEYACRAGSTGRYYWGDSNDESVMKRYCWYENNAHDSFWTEPHASEAGTQEVGGKLPNAWGLYDMAGNVWEWCQDWYGENYYSQSPLRDPGGPSSSEYRVLRGGCWNYFASRNRSSNRFWFTPGYINNNSGFRVVRDVEE